MKVQKVQSNTFESKKRYLTPQMLNEAKGLLDYMNEKAIYCTNGDYFKTTICQALVNDKGNVVFQDGRMYFGNKIKRRNIQGEILFTIGKTELVIDNMTGEIIDYYKPFYMTWKRTMKNISKSLEFFKNNLGNKKCVIEKKLTMPGLTKQGLEKYNKSKAGVNG